jgi:hypothetical protein
LNVFNKHAMMFSFASVLGSGWEMKLIWRCWQSMANSLENVVACRKSLIWARSKCRSNRLHLHSFVWVSCLHFLSQPSHRWIWRHFV